MMLAASPAVAERIGSSRDMFILKQVFFLPLAGGDRGRRCRCCRRAASGAWRIVGCLIALALTAATHGDRRGDQGRAALDLAARHVGAAARVPQAVLRRRRRLADQRGPPHAALPGHAARDRRLRADRAAAEVAARHRHAGGGHRGVLRAALHRRAEPGPGRHRRWSASAAPASAPTRSSRTCRSRVQRFLRSGTAGDNYQVTHRAGGVRQWRTARARPGRGPRQGRAARRACRLRLRRRRRGVRHDRLPGHPRACSPSSCCAACCGC